ncbi:hypothetical protein EON65_21325 [archaeon]|nr:MAG: hypothetical protein EON65_21325 [archaeon]
MAQHDLSSLQNSISYDPSSFRDYGDAIQSNRDHFMNPSGQQGVSNSKDTSIFHTGLGGVGDFKRVLNIKNTTSDNVCNASNIILSSFDNLTASVPKDSAVSSMKYSALDKELGLASRPQHILYCIAGHKMFSAFLPAYDTSNRDRMNVTGYERKEVSIHQYLYVCDSLVSILHYFIFLS